MRPIFLFGLLLLTCTIRAEKLPPILRRIVHLPGSVTTFTHSPKPFFPLTDLPSNFLEHYQHILKTPNGLFLTQSGTGRVYKIELKGDSIQLVRIDQTYFGGYNYYAHYFALDTTLFSFGGEGFWRFNGDLREFNPDINEWVIRPVDQHIARRFANAVKENFHFVDTTNRYFYMAGPKVVDDPVKSRFTVNSPWYGKLLRLQVDSTNWEVMGNIDDRWTTYFAHTPFGLYVDYYYLIDVQQNRVLKFSGKTLQRLENLPRSSEFREIRLTYCLDSTLYFGDMDNWIDSVKIDPKDIVDTGMKLYKPEPTVPVEVLSGAGLLLMLSGLGFWWWKKKRKLQPISAPVAEPECNNPITLQSNLSGDLLEEREKDVLRFILQNSKKGCLTTVAELNELLGLSKRTLEVQKRIRVDTLNAIIKKCQFLTQNEEPILNRLRSELDGRMFEYFIEEKRYSDAQQILGEML